MTLPALVMLGYELCGHYARDAEDPLEGPVTDELAPATNVEELTQYLDAMNGCPGVRAARQALECVADHAVSAPEAVLATIYSLPVRELGYGMGPVTLNERVRLGQDENSRSRFPDLMFAFALLGINYDGEEHLELETLEELARAAAYAQDDAEREAALKVFSKKRDQIRKKVVDDTARNRQLASKGRLVLPATKENLYGRGSLDVFTRDMLNCAHEIFGADISEYEKAINDTRLCAERYEMLASMLPFGRSRQQSRALL